MQVDTDEDTYVKIQGGMCNLLVRIDPDRYSKFVYVEQYMKLKKVLYGTLHAAILF